MIFIKKGNVPNIFSDTKRKYENYDNLRESSKNVLKEYLIKEQGGLCAYCMTRINLNNSTIEHYIPRNGINGDMSKSLDYDNLFAVCMNERNSGEKSRHCDVSKGDNLITIDPRKESDILQIKYKRDGEIYSDNGDFENDLNNTLNLNVTTLRKNRRSALDSALKSMARINKNTWKEEYVKKHLKALEQRAEKTEYIGIIVYELSKRLKRID